MSSEENRKNQIAKLADLSLEEVDDYSSARIVPLKSALPAHAGDDERYARENIIEAIEAGQIALKSLTDIVPRAQHPRFFEAMAVLLEKVVSANESLVRISRKASLPRDREEEGGDVTNNNLFVGSTAELLQMMRGKKGIDQ